MAHSTMTDRLPGLHPKMLAASLKTGEADRKPLAESEWRRRIGRLIDDALTIAKKTKQELSFAMGYSDQSALSRWIAAVERPLFDKLFSVEWFYDAWLIACAQDNPRVEVETVVKIRRRA